MTCHSSKPLIKHMCVRVAFKKNKRVHERNVWIITVFDTPSDIMRYSKRAMKQLQERLFTKKAKNKELIVREVLEVVELKHSNLTIDEHKRQYRKQVSRA
jgi:NADPH-dependent glutamate synthase beta subunit-like oxidoreductase